MLKIEQIATSCKSVLYNKKRAKQTNNQ